MFVRFTLNVTFSCKDMKTWKLFSLGPTLAVLDANIMPRGYGIMALWLLKVSSFLFFFPVRKLDPVIASGSK